MIQQHPSMYCCVFWLLYLNTLSNGIQKPEFSWCTKPEVQWLELQTGFQNTNKPQVASQGQSTCMESSRSGNFASKAALPTRLKFDLACKVNQKNAYSCYTVYPTLIRLLKWNSLTWTTKAYIGWSLYWLLDGKLWHYDFNTKHFSLVRSQSVPIIEQYTSLWLSAILTSSRFLWQWASYKQIVWTEQTWYLPVEYFVLTIKYLKHSKIAPVTAFISAGLRLLIRPATRQVSATSML